MYYILYYTCRRIVNSRVFERTLISECIPVLYSPFWNCIKPYCIHEVANDFDLMVYIYTH